MPDLTQHEATISDPSAQPTTAAPADTPPQHHTSPAPPRFRRVATDIALIANFAALIALCALLPAIPLSFGVPITLQTLAVILAGAVLGARRGFLAALLYLALGAIGLPIFSGGSSGVDAFAGPSVGYLIGFPIAASLTGVIVERLPRKRVATSVPLIFLAGFLSSIIAIHPLGILGLAWRADLTLAEAAILDLSFWPGDILKNIVMAIIATTVHRAFPDILPERRTRTKPTE